jgi:uncharacterized repeat protein (TIGR01451 family)
MPRFIRRRRRKAAFLGALLAVALISGRAMQSGGVSSFLTALRAAPATKDVTYRAARFDVPADWPVYLLARDPGRCVRFDVHAVYLGHQGAQPACPAALVGSSDAVQVEPLDAGSMERVGLTGSERVDSDGRIDRSDATAAERVVALPRLGVLVTIRYTDGALARRILDSFRLASGAEPATWPPGGSTLRLPERIAASVVYTGEGFDACTAPSTSTMNSWLSSPFRSIGVYIGGVARACSQGNLTSSWVSTVTTAGWKLVPTYVGLQAPCTSFTNRIDPAQAASQGTAAATDAVTQAAALGLGTGTPIYFDMEAYDSANSSCVSAVRTFISAWVGQLHASNYVAGMYSSVASGIQDQADNYNNPDYNRLDAIWFAHWDNRHSVFGDSYISDTVWPNHQRLHQYQGGHNETWGGVTINIDSNYDDGPTGVPSGTATCDPTADQVSIFQHASWGGICVVKGVGDYPTASSFTPLADNSASSIKVGANVQATLCDGANFTGVCDGPYTANDDHLSDEPIGNDTMSSFRVQSRSSSGADLAVTLTDSPDPVPQGSPLTYTAAVVNNGPSAATSVTLTDTLPAQVSFVSAGASVGSCSRSGSTVTCSLGTLAQAATATVTIATTAVTAGTATGTASVSAASPADPVTSNNSSTEPTTIGALLCQGSAVTILGTAGNDSLTGTAGADVIAGLAGSDTITGLAGDDRLCGGDGDDVIAGGAGADNMDGGLGLDTLDYAASSAGVTVNLAAATASAGDAVGDQLAGFENLTGSAYGDTLTGSSAANVIAAGGGKDALTGLAGADTLDGGTGTDTAAYQASPAAVTINLTTPSAAGGDAVGDVLVNIESAGGSAYNDSLTGTSGHNVLIGQAGNDVLTGGAGTDSFYGGAGTDDCDNVTGETASSCEL